MVLINNGEYLGEGTPADVISEICERSSIGLVSALVERIDFGKDYTLSFKEDTYERVTESGNLMHGIKMMVSADPLVRCKECRWAEPNREGDYDCRCHIPIFRVSADDYCSFGERKDNCNECWYWSEVHKRCENKCGCQFKPYGEMKSDE